MTRLENLLEKVDGEDSWNIRGRGEEQADLVRSWLDEATVDVERKDGPGSTDYHAEFAPSVHLDLVPGFEGEQMSIR